MVKDHSDCESKPRLSYNGLLIFFDRQQGNIYVYHPIDRSWSTSRRENSPMGPSAGVGEGGWGWVVTILNEPRTTLMLRSFRCTLVIGYWMSNM